MAVSGTRVTVTTTATLLARADADGSSGAVWTLSGAVTVDLGGSGVTAGAGAAMAAEKPVSIDLDAGEALYGIVATGTQVVHVLKNREQL